MATTAKKAKVTTSERVRKMIGQKNPGTAMAIAKKLGCSETLVYSVAHKIIKGCKRKSYVPKSGTILQKARAVMSASA